MTDESESQVKNGWSNLDQILTVGRAAFGINDKGETINLGNADAVIEYMKTGINDRNLALGATILLNAIKHVDTASEFFQGNVDTATVRTKRVKVRKLKSKMNTIKSKMKKIKK